MTTIELMEQLLARTLAHGYIDIEGHYGPDFLDGDRESFGAEMIQSVAIDMATEYELLMAEQERGKTEAG